jgi:hypothetical protein
VNLKPQRRFLAISLTVAVTFLLVLATPAAARQPQAAGSADALAAHSKTVDIVGGNFLKINESITTTYRFKPGKVHIKHGANLILTNHSDDGHSFTLVDKSLLPKTLGAVFSCGGPGTICGEVLPAHFPGGPPPGLPAGCNATDSPPCIQYLDNGLPSANPPALDQVNTLTLSGAPDGDSVVILPGGAPIVMTVTAPPGTDLPFMCIFHPWMQGELEVGAA